ncbi:hypothetical protein DT065_17345 [Salicibibacter kimchii]|uniref:Uncharacterized protein n=1 Tax=Salicibibacter kimchii TaxID=2099786 RepID=A0A345C2Z5_9BACI|nr:hypothetical protein DT065_17345 [Salicibibacter kimchii]
MIVPDVARRLFFIIVFGLNRVMAEINSHRLSSYVLDMNRFNIRAKIRFMIGLVRKTKNNTLKSNNKLTTTSVFMRKASTQT